MDKTAQPEGWTRVECPVCGAKKQKTLFTKDLLDERYDLVKCGCGLRFINPRPSVEKLKEYYDGEYDVPAHQREKIRRKAFIITNLLNVHGSRSSGKKKLIDIGASYGYFLDIARQEGFDVSGVETSAKASGSANERGLRVERGTLETSQAAKREGYYDAATMLDVLEHVPDPKTTIRTLNRMLRKDGLLAMTMPNGESSELRLFGRRWEWMSPPAHLWFFTPKSIARLLEENGYEVVHLTTGEGDTAGNLLFHTYLATRESGFYATRYVLGKKRLLAARKKVRSSLTDATAQSGKEFSGVSGLAKRMSEGLGFLLKRHDRSRYAAGRGPSIIVIARKKGDAA